MKCGHDGCNCQVAHEGEFCSEHCREHAGESGHATHTCECGHGECQATAAGADEERVTRDLQEAFE